MAVSYGKDGSVTFANGDVSKVVDWSLDATTSLAEFTNMASDADFKEYKGGIKNWTARVTCVEDSSPAIATVLGATTGLVLTDDSVTFTALSGKAMCIGVEVGTGIEDVNRHTYLFTSNGPIAMT